jgi:hypothetical protein
MFWAQFYHSSISDRQSRRWTVARIWLVRSNYCDFVTWTLKILEGLQQSFSKECSAVSDPLHTKQPRLFVVLYFVRFPRGASIIMLSAPDFVSKVGRLEIFGEVISMQA